MAPDPAPAPAPDDELRRLAGRLARVRTSPVLEVLAERRRLASRLDSYELELVAAARDAGHTWVEIGDALGIARQNAERKFRQVELRRRREQQ